MRYITGMQALNLTCSLLTTGDWHQAAIKWNKLRLKDTDTAFFGSYGIEKNSSVPHHPGEYLAANHIRACLDLIADSDFANAQGMNHDYIDNDLYDLEIFDHVSRLKNQPNWQEIDAFMEKEYKMKWLRYKEGSKDKGKK